MNTAIIIILLFVVTSLYFYRRHKVRLQLRNGQLSFNISYGETSGLLAMHISDPQNDEAIWDVHLNNFHGATLAYGEVPKLFKTETGSLKAAAQTFPLSGKPYELQEGRIYKLGLDWKKDFALAAASFYEEVFFTPKKHAGGEIFFLFFFLSLRVFYSVKIIFGYGGHQNFFIQKKNH